jgi:branched-chain amino acid transport system permease protein
LTPQYWQFWIGLMLVVIVQVGRERLARGMLFPFTWLIARARGKVRHANVRDPMK